MIGNIYHDIVRPKANHLAQGVFKADDPGILLPLLKEFLKSHHIVPLRPKDPKVLCLVAGITDKSPTHRSGGQDLLASNPDAHQVPHEPHALHYIENRSVHVFPVQLTGQGVAGAHRQDSEIQSGHQGALVFVDAVEDLLEGAVAAQADDIGIDCEVPAVDQVVDEVLVRGDEAVVGVRGVV